MAGHGLFNWVGPGPCSTIYGAGAFRQLGRLSLFNKVDLLYNRLQQAISRGSNATANRVMNYGGGQNQAMRMEIIIVTRLQVELERAFLWMLPGW